jgi:hypothetical protein
LLTEAGPSAQALAQRRERRRTMIRTVLLMTNLVLLFANGAAAGRRTSCVQIPTSVVEIGETTFDS